jgi:monofunctional biosynthetic peptidoglycan transglycosylase
MTFFKILTRLLIGFLLITCALSLLYRLVNPVSTVMLKRWAFGQHVEYSYVPIERMSPHLIKAIIVAEDGRFCAHHGVDWQEMKKALIDAAEDSTPRGASTLSMQVTRNLFLWQGRSYIRKILEVPLSMFVDPIIGKPRLLEIYLNVAEWGRGIFGAEAASQHYFHKSARYLSQSEATLLVSVLPDPARRNPAKPGVYTQFYANKIAQRLQKNTAITHCLR